MDEKRPLAHLQKALSALRAWLESEKIPYAVIGGVAASVAAEPRFTNDVDALVRIDETRWAPFLEAGAPRGFAGRRSDTLPFTRRSNVMLIVHQPTGIPVDLSLAWSPLEEEFLRRAADRDIEGVKVRVITPEDLLVMKILAFRPQDIADIASVLEVRTDLDLARVRRIVRRMAVELELPEAAPELERLIKRYAGKRARGKRGRRG